MQNKVGLACAMAVILVADHRCRDNHPEAGFRYAFRDANTDQPQRKGGLRHEC